MQKAEVVKQELERWQERERADFCQSQEDGQAPVGVWPYHDYAGEQESTTRSQSLPGSLYIGIVSFAKGKSFFLLYVIYNRASFYVIQLFLKAHLNEWASFTTHLHE